MKHWFLPQGPDVLALLRDQATVTVEGVDAFAGWSAGDLVLGRAIRDAEHAADGIRRELQRALRSAFSTPMDAEDLYELSERLDVVLNAAKNAVREAEVMNVSPNTALATMASELAAGVHHLQDALGAVAHDPDAATDAADLAVRCERRVERAYRAAMSDLLALDDLREIVVWREMYRRYARMGEAIVHVADRVWYAVVKEG